MILDYLNRFANKFGCDIKKTNEAIQLYTDQMIPKIEIIAGLRTQLFESYSHLRKLGVVPATIIDVGVAKGTPELYNVFPESYFLLIEPLREFEEHMKAILLQYHGSYAIAAAGPESKEITFNVHSNHIEGSSLYKESMGAEADGYEITVPMVRVDDVVKERKLSGPFLIKIDVQGAELDVLDGALDTMQDAEAVVLEVSMFQFMKGAPLFHDVIFYMKQHGFVAYDIVLGWNRPLDNALGQVDIVFVKENGLLRRDHSFSTVVQMKEIFGS